MENNTWSELFDKENEPQVQQIQEYVNTPLWDEQTAHMQQIYNSKPALSYSSCAMDKGFWKGWNVKYKKGCKSLCTLYPKQGYFMALVPVGKKEMIEADLLVPLCGEYTQNLYNSSKTGATGKSLAFEVTDKDILHDMQKIIALRVTSK